MSEVIYRPALKTDAPELAKLSILASGGTFDLLLKGLSRRSVEEVMTALCESENTEYSYHNFLVAEVDGKVAGAVNTLSVQARYDLAPNINPLLQTKFNFGIIQLIKFYFRARHLKGMNELKVPSRNSLHVNDIAVFPEYSGQGIGKDLMRRVIERAKAENFDYVSLYVWTDNTHAIEFYKHLGFIIQKTASVKPHMYLPHTSSHLMLTKI
jgi:ribosomal protein S18 acetylase RimI-like enzyme